MPQKLADILASRPLLFDGAMGTQIQAANLHAADFGGEAFFGCNEYLNLTRPDVIQSIHEAYLAAGADVIETNTFGATPLVLGEFGLSEKAAEINAAAVAIAKRATAKFDTPKFIAGSIGPTTKALSLTGGATFEELQATFTVQICALVEAGVDLLIFETTQDTLNLKAALAAFAELRVDLPIIISFTIERSGTMLAGQTIEAALASIEHFHPLAVGLNCATGPAEMSPYVRTLADRAPFFTSVLPNAGLPDADGRYSESPETFARTVGQFLTEGWVNIVGGCCGTTPDHIRALKKLLSGAPIRRPAVPHKKLWLSGLELVEIENNEVSAHGMGLLRHSDDVGVPRNDTQSTTQLFVGERTNSIGSKKFRELVAATDFDAAAEIGRAQIKAGSHILDVCTANPDRDELADFTAVIAQLNRRVKAPLMLDTTDAKVLEAGLKLTQGKCIVNSINLEDGEKRFAEIVPLAKKYGAALVVGLIDEEGMAVTRERKLAVAARSYDLLTQKYGVAASDIVFDPLVFPVGTGDEKFLGSAIETFAALAEITRRYPDCGTTLGISNCSFGLPAAGREVLNAVYLYEATRAGLSLPIVNTEKLRRYASIPEHERMLAEELIRTGSKAAIDAFAAHFRMQVAASSAPRETLPSDAFVRRAIVEGSKDGVTAALDALLTTTPALAIINDVLMAGMAEVGELFGANKLIVAEVLQSAEVMKAAVDYLKPHLERGEDTKLGTILLATVKGDVHDIGKNLVEIIFTNNGIEVINLGIKVESARLIAAAREHQPDLIGLSGLLVRSAQEMVATANDLKNAGITAPILVGGAALTELFTTNKIAPAYAPASVSYARDAMAGLALAKKLLSGDVPTPTVAPVAPAAAPTSAAFEHPRLSLAPFCAPVPTDFTRHTFATTDLEAAYAELNLQMLFGKHLGFFGHFKNALARGEAKAVALWEQFQSLKKEIAAKQLLQPKGVWQFFRARREGDTGVVLFNKQNDVLARFDFPRRETTGLCIADALDTSEDTVALFVTTVGAQAGEQANAWKQSGDYLRSHFLAALALETAEATAELVHSEIRKAWGIPAGSGVRVSFGYPACPDLADQTKLFDLLRPTDIGVTLTEGMMMMPEASVSALVLAHPEGLLLYR